MPGPRGTPIEGWWAFFPGSGEARRFTSREDAVEWWPELVAYSPLKQVMEVTYKPVLDEDREGFVYAWRNSTIEEFENPESEADYYARRQGKRAGAKAKQRQKRVDKEAAVAPNVKRILKVQAEHELKRALQRRAIERRKSGRTAAVR